VKKLESAIKALLENLGIAQKILENQVLYEWPSIVGKRIGEVTKAEKIEGKTLFIKVTHSTWRNELLFHKKDIIKKINKRIGKEIVTEIRMY